MPRMELGPPVPLLNLDRQRITYYATCFGKHYDNVLLPGGQYKMKARLARTATNMILAVGETIDRKRGSNGAVFEIDSHFRTFGREKPCN